MKNIYTFFLISLLAFFSSSISFALPVDLTTFTAQEGVFLNGNVVTFSEADMYYMDQGNKVWLDQTWFYDDNFSVAGNAGVLSFDYNFELGPNDNGDYLEFDLNFNGELFIDITKSGHYEIDFTAYQGNTVSLAWGLIWDGDSDIGTIATVSNIDLSVSDINPVPEPCTMILFSTGALTLAGLRRRKKTN